MLPIVKAATTLHGGEDKEIISYVNTVSTAGTICKTNFKFASVTA